LDGVSDNRLTVTCVGDSTRVDLHHLGIIGTVERSAEEELLTDPDVPVFHGPSIPGPRPTFHEPRWTTFYQVENYPPRSAVP